MEEKIYFKPAKYGKGIKKKEQKEKPVEKADGKKTHRVRSLILFLLFIAIIVIIILWLLHGKTTTIGQYPENVRNEYLECSSNNLKYSKVSRIDSDNKQLRITAVFKNPERLSSLSLNYSLTYKTDTEAYAAESISHAQFGVDLTALGYSSEKFNNKFTLMGNKLVISLQSNTNGFDDGAWSYFLIMPTDETIYPITLEKLKRNYEAQGLACASSLDEK